MNQSTKAYNGESVIVCLALPELEGGVLHSVTQLLNPDVELEDVEDLHITLAYLGKVEDLQKRKNEILQTVLDFSRNRQSIPGVINGGGMFSNQGDGKPVWAFYESQSLYAFRQGITNQLMTNTINVSRPFGFVPHITMTYLDGNTPFVLQFPSLSIEFTNISVWWAGERYNFPLQQAEKEVSATPTTAYGHGPEGLFSFPGLEEEAEKKAREALPDNTDERIVKLWKEAYMKKRQRQKSALYVFKDVTGRYRWLSISSTAFKDKDGEIVSQQALKGAVEKMQRRANYGPLRFWHTKGLDFGECDYSDVLSRSLIESGTFINESVGKTVAEKAPAYKMSIGFNYPPGQPDTEGVYKDIDIFERSLVPADLASNLFTGLFVTTEAIKMYDSQKEAAVLSALKGLGLPDDDYNRLVGQVKFSEKSADNVGVQYKDISQLSPPELLEYAQKAVEEYEQEQEAHKEITQAVTKAVSEQTKGVREEMKAMMEKMNAMMRRMDGGKDDDDDDEEKGKKTKEAADPELQTKLNEAEKQIQDLTAQLQQVTKSVNDLANTTPRRATTADDNIINTVAKNVQNGAAVVDKPVNQAPGQDAQTLKDNFDNFTMFLAGGGV